MPALVVEPICEFVLCQLIHSFFYSLVNLLMPAPFITCCWYLTSFGHVLNTRFHCAVSTKCAQSGVMISAQ